MKNKPQAPQPTQLTNNDSTGRKGAKAHASVLHLKEAECRTGAARCVHAVSYAVQQPARYMTCNPTIHLGGSVANLSVRLAYGNTSQTSHLEPLPGL